MREQLILTYTQEKEKLRDISLWVRPFLVPSDDAQSLLTSQDAPRGLIAQIAADFPVLLWEALRARPELDSPQLWLEIEQTQRGKYRPIERLLHYPSAPASLLQWAFGAGYQRLVLAHPACTEELLSQLSTGAIDPYRQEQRQSEELLTLHRALNPNTKASTLEALISQTSSAEILQAIAENPSANTRVLSLLWSKGDACHPMIARHPKAAPFLWQEFFQDSSLRSCLAQNPSLPTGFVVRLCESFASGGAREAEALMCLALHPELSLEAKGELSSLAVSTKNANVAFALLLNSTGVALDDLSALSPLLRNRSFSRVAAASDAAAEYRWRCAQPLSHF